MTRRLFLVACFLPLAVTVSATPHIIDTGILAQRYGDPRPTGFVVVLKKRGRRCECCVWQVNPDGPPI